MFCRKKLESLLVPDENPVIEGKSYSLIKTDNNDVEFFKKFLRNIIQIETGIIALSERIPKIHFEQQEYALYEKQYNGFKEEQLVRNIEKEIESAKLRIETAETNPYLEYDKDYQKIIESKGPFVYKEKPNKPTEPTLEKPGFFNKKKVEAQNAEIIASYKGKIAEWERQVAEINAENEKVKENEGQAKQEARKALFDKYDTELLNLKEKLTDAKTKSGTDGVYNLYETEIRQNTIISQLSEVITNLEAMKNNQFVIYDSLKKMNAGLDQLNRSMESVIGTLNSIDYSTRKMSKNSEVIAYNSAVTAYYSKRNAELTDAA